MTADWWSGLVCPRCGAEIKSYPATSRCDNKTNICSDCGLAEAMHNFFKPEVPLPPVTEVVG